MSGLPVALLLTLQSASGGPCGVMGTIVDPMGGPIANARVEVVDGGVQAVVAPERGHYCLPAFPSRRQVRLLVTAEGYQDQLSPPIDVGPGIQAQVEVTLTRRFAEHVTVTGRADNLVGVSASASEGSIGIAELEARPLLRSGDVMEAVPGVAMTQHSTGGHAPIILLRGYNLDHGTDFATFLEGVPLNLPSHAHAQGYTDLNFLITELIGRIDFQKGPYAASVGDFSTAGAANIELPDTVPRPFAAIESGPHNFYRGVAGGSITRGSRRWLFGADASHYDGPSVVSDDFRRAKGLLRYSDGDAQRGRSLSVYSYGARWNASDGYPERALHRGYITRFGTLDPTDGGRSQLHLAIGSLGTVKGERITRITGYAQYYDFDLFSNLTFWTRDARLGDQIQQSERRFASGVLVSQKRFYSWPGRSLEMTIGAQVRNDLIGVRLFNTSQRLPTDKHDELGRTIPAQVYDNDVSETSVSPYVHAQVRWTPWLRTVFGARGDVFHMRVDSDQPANSGSTAAAVMSPKLGIVFGAWRRTELYVNAGFGFHSNHANGVLQRVDAATGSATRQDGRLVTSSDPLVRTRGAEAGFRTLAVPHLQSSVSLWIIDSDSELIYAPAAGFTKPERPGRRFGIEWNNFYRVLPWLTADLDAAWSSAQYRIDPDFEGRSIPDAIQGVISAGASVVGGRLSASLRGRYLGRRPLVADATAFSRPSLVTNGQLALRVGVRFDVGVDVFNILNRQYEDIAYYFGTRIRDPRPGGVLEDVERADFVTHPGEPRTARVRFRARF